MATSEFGEWIDWAGGEDAPAPSGTRVEVRFRDATGIDPEAKRGLVDQFRWWHDTSARNGDVVAYRLANESVS